MGWCVCKYKFEHGMGLCEHSEPVRRTSTCHVMERAIPISMLKACPMGYDKPEGRKEGDK